MPYLNRDGRAADRESARRWFDPNCLDFRCSRLQGEVDPHQERGKRGSNPRGITTCDLPGVNRGGKPGSARVVCLETKFCGGTVPDCGFESHHVPNGGCSLTVKQAQVVGSNPTVSLSTARLMARHRSLCTRRRRFESAAVDHPTRHMIHTARFVGGHEPTGRGRWSGRHSSPQNATFVGGK